MNLSPPLTSQSPPAGMAPQSHQPEQLELILQIQELDRQGASLPVETVLARHPESAHSQSLVFDLAYEEYHQRCQAGSARTTRTVSLRSAGTRRHC